MERFTDRDPGSTRTLLGEPVTRPDGIEVALYHSDYDRPTTEICFRNIVNPERGTVASVQHFYSDEDVLKIGDGVWEEGVMVIAQTGYLYDFSVPGFRRHLDELLDSRE